MSSPVLMKHAGLKLFANHQCQLGMVLQAVLKSFLHILSPHKKIALPGCSSTRQAEHANAATFLTKW